MTNEFELPQRLNELRNLCFQEAKDKGWHSSENINFPAYIANTVSETIELYEAWRKGSLNEPCDKAAKMIQRGIEPLTCAEEELADILIRIFDTAAVLNIDVEKAIRSKLLFNRTREFRNGGKLA